MQCVALYDCARQWEGKFVVRKEGIEQRGE
jgi:hypothetical protein